MIKCLARNGDTLLCVSPLVRLKAIVKPHASAYVIRKRGKGEKRRTVLGIRALTRSEEVLCRR